MPITAEEIKDLLKQRKKKDEEPEIQYDSHDPNPVSVRLQSLPNTSGPPFITAT